MTVSEFTIKQNDTAEALTATLNDSIGTVFSLAGCAVVFSMRSYTTGLIKVNRAAATIVNAANRQVKYVWAIGDTSLAGEFSAEFEVTFLDGSILTFPNGLNSGIFVHIIPQVA